jgi:hypothetical protein
MWGCAVGTPSHPDVCPLTPMRQHLTHVHHRDTGQSAACTGEAFPHQRGRREGCRLQTAEKPVLNHFHNPPLTSIFFPRSHPRRATPTMPPKGQAKRGRDEEEDANTKPTSKARAAAEEEDDDDEEDEVCARACASGAVCCQWYLPSQFQRGSPCVHHPGGPPRSPQPPSLPSSAAACEWVGRDADGRCFGPTGWV